MIEGCEMVYNWIANKLVAVYKWKTVEKKNGPSFLVQIVG
jgi:hypothetical protein